ncbi:hypothetical protein [Streptomyces avermitilis]|uniref:hypothetical protein n=1 Tax=Streptomyces avermitilis TaxID=33903 RepID=UPI0037220D98
MRSATIAWLRDRNEQVDLDFAHPQGAPIGSVVDIRVKHAGLSLHLDQSVEPAWDQDGCEPVLGVSVPVDPDTECRCRWTRTH